MTDSRLALRMLDLLAIDSDGVRFATIPGAPRGKSWAKSTQHGGGSKPADARVSISGTLRMLFPKPLTGNVVLGCAFFRPNRQRIDVDNMLKHVCDSATGIAWLDDSQVTSILGTAELDPENPRTVLMIARHRPSLVRDRGAVRTCEPCGKSFVRTSSKPQRICSEQCRLDWQRGRNRSRTKREWTPCIICGSQTSRPGVKRCRACWKRRAREHADALHVPGAVIRIRGVA